MNLPNKLTVFRIILVPIMIFVWLFPYEQFNFMFYEFNFGPVSLSSLNIVVLVIFALASITDMLDGMIARKYNMITTFGKFADPIADKLLVNTTLIIMVSKHLIPVLPVVIMLGRDIIVDGCRMIASKNGVVVAAGYLGKLKTVSQMITIILVLLNNLPFELYGIPMASIVLWFATLTSVMGGYSYFIQLKDYIFESK
ncbi:MAG: CDP-diacylglycerol--glycerol-3-phosphate 3-phosphatidyltransferase [Erysipelotrichaceae bacterium]|nr:CDP-diacylglycerol--glycerol-3-phosphate 3-phosphatidyltransferase [Bacillota bacterium]MDY3092576.1 CDP-diacylglycerol--glycerol-3-phosphate 3-phosphatidyltransferase [Erysipelotrichaceae bacterium]